MATREDDSSSEASRAPGVSRRTFLAGSAAAGVAATGLAGILAAGRVTVCTQCAARREISETDGLPGVRIAGAAVFVEEAMADDARALVY